MKNFEKREGTLKDSLVIFYANIGRHNQLLRTIPRIFLKAFLNFAPPIQGIDYGIESDERFFESLSGNTHITGEFVENIIDSSHYLVIYNYTG